MTTTGSIPIGGSGAATGAATAPDKGLTAKAKEYGQTVAEAASQAKDYARQNPGQALLIAAAAGFVIGLLVRGGRR